MRIHAAEFLSVYGNRDSFEKAFLMRGRNQQSGGILFIFFLSLIIRKALKRGMVSSGLMQRYSLENTLLGQKRLHVVNDANGNMSDMDRTWRQKHILEALHQHRGGINRELRLLSTFCLDKALKGSQYNSEHRQCKPQIKIALKYSIK